MNLLPKKPLSKNIKISVGVLLIANLFSLIGVIFLGWSSSLLLLGYWFESAIIGFFTIFKIILANKTGNNIEQVPIKNKKIMIYLSKIILIAFFIFHFGDFMIAHFILIIPVFISSGFKLSFPTLSSSLSSISLLLVSLFISHTYSFFSNYIGKKEYEKISPSGAMIQPYSRIVIMQIAVMLGAFLSVGLIAVLGKNEPSKLFTLGQAIVLILIKTSFDVFSHINQHQKLELLS